MFGSQGYQLVDESVGQGLPGEGARRGGQGDTQGAGGPVQVLTAVKDSRTFVRTYKESRWQRQLVSKSGSVRKAKPRSPSPLTWSTSRSAISSAPQPKIGQNKSCASTNLRLACPPRSSTVSSKPWMTQPVQARRFVAPLAARATSSLADRCFTLRRSIPTFSGWTPSTPASQAWTRGCLNMRQGPRPAELHEPSSGLQKIKRSWRTTRSLGTG